MPNEDLVALLNQSRIVLDRYLFQDDGTLRDDVAAVCMAIDDALPSGQRLERTQAAEASLRECSAAA